MFHTYGARVSKPVRRRLLSFFLRVEERRAPRRPPNPNATIELGNYLASKGGDKNTVADWSVGKNQRGDTIFIDPATGRIFRSKPEVARFLGLPSK